LLARNLASELAWDCIPLLKKVRHTKKQTSLSKAQRLSNLDGAFQWQESANLHTGIRHILLVDDVTTTGSTLHEVAKAIKARYPSLVVW